MYLLHDLIDRIFRRYIFVTIDGPTLHIWLFLYSIKINGNVNCMLSNAKKGHANSSGEEIEIESLVLNHALFRYLVLTW